MTSSYNLEKRQEQEFPKWIADRVSLICALLLLQYSNNELLNFKNIYCTTINDDLCIYCR